MIAAKLVQPLNVDKAPLQPLGEAIDRLIAEGVELKCRVYSNYSRKFAHQALTKNQLEEFHWTCRMFITAAANPDNKRWSIERPSFALLGITEASPEDDKTVWFSDLVNALWNDKALSLWQDAVKDSATNAKGHVTQFDRVMGPIADMLNDEDMPPFMEVILQPLKHSILGALCAVVHIPSYKKSSPANFQYLIPASRRDSTIEADLGRPGKVLNRWVATLPEIKKLSKDYLACHGAESEISNSYYTMEMTVKRLVGQADAGDTGNIMKVEEMIEFVKTNYPALNALRTSIRARSFEVIDGLLTEWLEEQVSSIPNEKDSFRKAEFASIVKELLALVSTEKARGLYRKVNEDILALEETDTVSRFASALQDYIDNANQNTCELLTKSLNSCKTLNLENEQLSALLNETVLTLPAATDHTLKKDTDNCFAALWEAVATLPAILSSTNDKVQAAIKVLKAFTTMSRLYKVVIEKVDNPFS